MVRNLMKNRNLVGNRDLLINYKHSEIYSRKHLNFITVCEICQKKGGFKRGIVYISDSLSENIESLMTHLSNHTDATLQQGIYAHVYEYDSQYSNSTPGNIYHINIYGFLEDKKGTFLIFPYEKVRDFNIRFKTYKLDINPMKNRIYLKEFLQLFDEIHNQIFNNPLEPDYKTSIQESILDPNKFVEVKIPMYFIYPECTDDSAEIVIYNSAEYLQKLNRKLKDNLEVFNTIDD